MEKYTDNLNAVRTKISSAVNERIAIGVEQAADPCLGPLIRATGTGEGRDIQIATFRTDPTLKGRRSDGPFRVAGRRQLNVLTWPKAAPRVAIQIAALLGGSMTIARSDENGTVPHK